MLYRDADDPRLTARDDNSLYREYCGPSLALGTTPSRTGNASSFALGPATDRVCAHAHPTSDAARNGNAKNGNGRESGVKLARLKRCAAVIACSTDATTPMTRTGRGMNA